MNISVPVLLSISCKGIANKDALSKSDPFCVVLENQKEVGKTETVKNNLNPIFNTKIQVNYFFEQVQKLEFHVRDDDGKKWDELGLLSITLAEIMTKSQIEKPLVLNSKEKGSIIISGKEIKQLRAGVVKMTINGINLDKKDTFGKSDPYLHIYNALTNQKLFTSETIKNTLNPAWQPLSIPYVEKYRVDCFDWDKNSDHDLIGSGTFNADQFNEPFEIDLISKKNKKAGSLKFTSIRVVKQYTFLDYIQNGTLLNFAVAIDFTGSNGDPKDAKSLHYIGDKANPSQKFTAYEQAITSIGNVLEYYDADRMFPVFGFGAKIKGQVFHDFNVTLQPNPEVFGVQGILGAYRNCIYQVDLYGPTVITFNLEFCTNYS
eukprot:NODE_624_length_5307_cov_0.437980.p3 type:complete len:375 gc:universal NODE_624_length_5307_cov_0.437980:3296-2172(-)